MNKLIKEAKAVVDNKHCEFRLYDAIEALRQAVQDAETYKPMTDDELISLIGNSQIYNQYSGWAWEREIERAVIKRLGLVWGEQ